MSQTKRVLLIREDDDARERMATLLRTQGFETDTACCGGEALLRLEGGAPDPWLILVDLPRTLGGEELVEILRTRVCPDVTRVVRVDYRISAGTAIGAVGAAVRGLCVTEVPIVPARATATKAAPVQKTSA